MRIKEATYNLVGGGKTTVKYDVDAPCRVCGLPVGATSMGVNSL